ncbi:hypothetical protein F5Y10DRAFT_239872 [Nemania abortiva]|nr:hypothetical protein F5Y10DRAFT_239872 [Nemania abortiva]
MRMHSVSRLLQALLLAVALRPAACSFSLDTVVTDWWYYVHNHLADTTSSACLAAYAAPIDCDMTLLGLVSSESPNFNPGPDDLESMCVPSCADSLNAWVQNVKSACNQDGDAALVSQNQRPYPEVPVAVVGEVFQYQYTDSCSKNVSGWCYFNYPTSPEWARPDFTCGNECASQFYSNAHNLPGSAYWFRIYSLEAVSDWWEENWKEGWEHVLECRKEGTSTISRPGSTQTITSFVSETTSSYTFPDETDTPTPTPTPTSTESSSSSSSASETATTVASEPPRNTNAGERLRVPPAFRMLAWIWNLV